MKRLDLLEDDELDRFRVLHPEAGVAALDLAVALDDAVEAALAERLQVGSLETLAARPVLATFVCMACGASAVGEATRPWEVDRAMRRSGLAERDLLRVLATWTRLGGTSIDELTPEILLELARAARG